MLHAINISFPIFNVFYHYYSEILMLLQEVSAAGLEIYWRSSCSTSAFPSLFFKNVNDCAGSVRNILQRSTQLQQPYNRLLVDLGCQSEAQATATVSQEIIYIYTSYGRYVAIPAKVCFSYFQNKNSLLPRLSTLTAPLELTLQNLPAQSF